ncbi:Gfo/Idh/MocA family oxidoreductase [Streptomyces sp. A7024]|uniref:Gfo/Idh/MocA family oxidoreductase n=1 Tax=Streptomyces coryli TaxID=1128680 RepID=A0A6G4U9C3_9ACTN|nr:Gfo/Idh/MocA family oxidoreductase [Streptomyces coryli]NGN67978.1 Gfo/Idh/MocA family oxidoreductase [Streptomyces coryli]
MRIGLLGTGPWAEKAHAPALQAHPDVTFTGVWGRRPEAAKEIADAFGTRPYDDVDALLADCDAVAVALPPDVQAPLAVRAAEAGKHLLLDKPVATTAEGARLVADAVERAGVASVVFFTMRFADVSADWLAGQTGQEGWLVGRADWLSPVFSDSGSPYAASPWRAEKGALWDVGPHVLSMLLPALGDVALDEVRAVAGPGDTVHLTLRHDGGALSSCTLSHTVPQAAAGVTVELRGAPGVAVVPERDGRGPVPPYGRAIDALLASARSGVPHPCDVRFGQRVTEILATAEARLGV